ncbi:aromatic acid exporter family protein [Streptomyces syringium]|uniref:FUSC family protein n=1 Tax=Streptomyces syringium TaxID=76729 RepID=UPI00344068C7
MRHAAGGKICAEAAGVARSVRRAWQGPGRERDLVVLALKATLAAVLAWSAAAWLLRNTLALMAPWVALVLVRTTVYRSVAWAIQQTLAIALGTVVATAGAMVLGRPVVAMLLVLPVMLLIGNWQHFGEQGIAGATSALFTLAGGEWSAGIAADRVLAAFLGAGVGVMVNALVLPPVYLHSVHEAAGGVVRECCGILEVVAEGLKGPWRYEQAVRWQERARRLPGLLRALRSAVEWAEESTRLNPERRRRARPAGPLGEETLRTLEDVADHLQGLTRVLAEAAADSVRHAEVTRPYADFLHGVGQALTAYGRTVTGEDTQDARRELERTLRQVEAAHGDLRARLAGRPVLGAAAVELSGSLLAEARRLACRLCRGGTRGGTDASAGSGPPVR